MCQHNCHVHFACSSGVKEDVAALTRERNALATEITHLMMMRYTEEDRPGITLGRFTIRYNTSTAGWGAGRHIIENHTGATSQRFGGLTLDHLREFRELLGAYLKENS